jgi:solute carrier family 13 (sodium-dependent dicarboxylate transporter), member 2/3/5
MKRWLLLGVSLVIFGTILVLPTPEGLTPEGQRSLAIFALAIFLWVTQVIPNEATSLLAMALLPVLGVFSEKRTFQLFGNEAVFFILGAFILAAALMRTGLSTRLALLFLSRFKQTPQRLLMGVFLSASFLSCWMSEHAVAALMLPIVLEIARGLDLQPFKSRYAKALFLYLAWGAVIGGVATFLGGARNVLAVAMLSETYNLSIGFFEWMLAVAPLVILMLVAAWFVVRFSFPADIQNVTQAEAILRKRVSELGPLSQKERRLSIVMLLTIFAWVFLTDYGGLAVYAIIASVLLFVLNIVNWKDIEEYVNWGVILMYGGAIAIASAVAKTGAAGWLVSSMIGPRTLDPFLLIMLLVIVTSVMTEWISNSAAVAVLLPAAFSVAQVSGINPIVVVYAIALPAGLAFCLPMSSPPNAICFASGYLFPRDTMKAGLFLKILAPSLFLLMVKFYWPLLGIQL